MDPSPKVFSALLPHDHSVPSSRISELNPESAPPVEVSTVVPEAGGGGGSGLADRQVTDTLPDAVAVTTEYILVTGLVAVSMQRFVVEEHPVQT